ncbi:ankyrin repeat domain-containing protein [Pseudoalteromonas ruthenica]|nr:ankyrin repeat domain-containing protein [Pseudoalteromonas ruthenica]TMO89727.1 ankyrin repeat domain-containing protein [Pseudoalteromonas ruthenica]TMO92153.1 ankyrin repeat domain-containing protein [Pseudoalteromonas ruthenica]TMP01343.1 ankyrin repeat domain-containing protein [Pseudoalteromonas ruthenica]TMP07289.1 ankyrin repeat domain-containing protein [Pseudoalteromonas ruthenica]
MAMPTLAQGMKAEQFFEPSHVILLNAIKAGDKQAAQAIIDTGVALDVHGEHGITPLFWLAMETNEKSLRLALDLGADPDFPAYVTLDRNGPTEEQLLSALAGSDKTKMMQVLLEYNASPNAVDASLEPALFNAVANDKDEQVNLLLAHGVDLNATDAMNNNAANYSALMLKYKYTLLFITQGGDFSAPSATGGTVANSIERDLRKKLLRPGTSNYDYAMKVKELLIEKGVSFPPPSPKEVRAAN